MTNFRAIKSLFPLIFVAIIGLVACGGGGGGTAAPAAGTAAQPVQLAAVVLSGGQEIPAVPIAASGSATVTVSADRSQIDFNVTFTGLSSATTLSHIHIGPPGAAGPPIVNLALVGGFASPLAGTATAADFVPAPAQGITTFAEAVDAILAGNTYINVHTVNNPGGEIRGALGPATLTTTLTGNQEVPPVATAGTGTATFSFDNLQTAIDFNVTFSGLTSATTLAHIHVGAPGVAGPPIVNLDLVGGFTSPLAGTATAADLAAVPAQGINTFADAINAILSGNAYVNVHTVNNPGGEIRGQLVGVLGGAGATPVADIFSSIGNTTLTVPAPGLLANDPAGTLVLDPGTRATTGGGSATVNADGSFTYEPLLGAQNVNDTFNYMAAGNAAVPVTISLVERAWYVDNSFAGASDGSNDAPFTTLGAALGSADANDTLFVFAGNAPYNNQSITLLAGQKLIGQGFGLTVSGRVIVAAGALPVISNLGLAGVPVLILADNNEVAGIQIESVTNEAIRGASVTGFSIHDNVIPAPNREGIRILSPGTGSIVNNDISGDPAGREGILITNTEDAAGNGVAPVIVTATLTIVDNIITDVTSAGRQGIRVNFDGLGTAVNLAINGNDISNSNAEGIQIVSGPAGATVNADVIGNILLNNNGGAEDFLAQANGASAMCVELINNGNLANTAIFQVANNTGNAANFRFFENANDAPAVRNPAPAQFTNVTEGTCGVP